MVLYYLYLLTHLFTGHLSTTMTTSALDQVSEVDIDVGVFKYILIKVHHDSNGEEISKNIVRG